MSSIRLGNTGGFVGAQKYADFSETPLFGRGLDGAVNSAVATYNINTGLAGPGSGGRLVDAPKALVTVISGSTITVSGALTNFRTNDVCLLINLQGSSTRFSRVGTWERVYIDNASGSDVFLKKPVSELYGETGVGVPTNADLTGQKIMLLRIPEYTTFTLSGTASLTCDAFDGSIGGVVAFACRTLNVLAPASVHANGKGYRAVAAAPGESYAPSVGGQRGSAGATGVTPTPHPTPGSVITGGGGGGGGGGSGGGGGYRSAGTAGLAGGGGGGGGARVSTAPAPDELGKPGTIPTGGAGGIDGGPLTTWGSGGNGGDGGAAGVVGSSYGQDSADTGITLFMGAGGGAGGAAGPGGLGGPGGGGFTGGSGGAGSGSAPGGGGGGLVLIWAENVVNFVVAATGSAGGIAPNATNGASPGFDISGGGGGGAGSGGGGGAGGATIVAAAVVAGTNTATVTGGAGGSGAVTAGTGGAGGSSGPGGNGASTSAPGGVGSLGRVVVRTFTPTLATTPDAVGGFAPVAAAFKGTL